MGEINAALGANGAGHILRSAAAGVQWTVLPPTQACYAEFESWLEDSARKRLERRRAHMPPDVYEEERAALRRDINSFVYSWGRETSKQAMRSIEGNTEFAAILIRQSHPQVKAADVKAALEADPDHYQDVLMAVMGVDDPNKKAVAAEPNP